MTIFNGETKPELPEIDPSKDYLDELVGEGKKFKTTAELARAKAESDRHILVLEAEREAERQEVLRLREESASMATLQTVLDRLNAAGTDSTPPAPKGNLPPESAGTPTDVKRIVQEALDERLQQDRAQSNQSRVIEVLTQNFGPGYQKVVLDKAKDLGIDSNLLDSLATTSPKALFAIVGAQEGQGQGQPATAPAPGTRFVPKGKTKNFEYFETLRRTDSARYFSPAVQKELFEERRRQGEAFWS